MPRQQKPPIGEVQRIRVTRGPYRHDEDRDDQLILYKREEDGWHVAVAGVDDDYWKFASADARDRDVRQLINKKWDYRFGDPDDLDDMS